MVITKKSINNIIKVIKLLVIIYIKMNKDVINNIIINLTDLQTAGLVFFGLSMCSLIGLFSIKAITEEYIKMDKITSETWHMYNNIKQMDSESINIIKLMKLKKDFEVNDSQNTALLSLDLFLVALEGLLIFSTYLSYEEYTQAVTTYKKWLKAKSLKIEDNLQ